MLSIPIILLIFFLYNSFVYKVEDTEDFIFFLYTQCVSLYKYSIILLC